jgi:SET domain-containing protein
MAVVRKSPRFRVRRSKVHGLGVFATRRIRKGTRIVEYLGERVSHKVADDRYEQKDADDGHTFLFIVDRGVVIDAGVDGNEARFINHGCDPNCESVIEDRRVFIEAIRTIQPGEELKYDYQIGRDDDDPENVDEVFACRCGLRNGRRSGQSAPGGDGTSPHHAGGGDGAQRRDRPRRRAAVALAG